eukprot:GFYU01001288.1.p1 GENE.GFYU01001288.1~~GFYU01001288.1.p1  ORF type:complete len:151 (-),score=56.34 GFYU01001288.1:139-591(-)
MSVKLRSRDDTIFEIDRETACMSLTVKNMLDDTGSDAPIPLSNVDAKTLSKVVEFCKYHQQAKQNNMSDDDKQAWDKEFVKVDQPVLFELILAANYLDIKDLLDLTCRTVADMIKGKTPEEIRKTFNIKNDFTPEEEEEVRRENSWCEDR